MESFVGKETLNQILQEVISTRLNEKGFKWNNNDLWFTGGKEGIRHVFKYQKLKGKQGTFAWGVCLDFVPTKSSNKLKYHRTDKSVTLHLFEWPEEYANSFLGRQLGDVTTEWGEKEAKQSITQLFNKYEKRIFDWYEEANNIDNIIKIATNQTMNKIYEMHYPNPDYVLAFLYAAKGDIENALIKLKLLKGYYGNEELESKLRLEIQKIYNQKIH